MKHADQGIEERLGDIERLVDKIDRSIEKIELVTIVREPNTSMAADAYNGLRKQIIAAIGERNAHLYQLASFALAVDDAVPYDQLRHMVREWMEQAALIRVTDPNQREYFEIVGGDGEAIRAITPAYVDGPSGRPIKMGKAERTAKAPLAPGPRRPGSAESDIRHEETQP